MLKYLDYTGLAEYSIKVKQYLTSVITTNNENYYTKDEVDEKMGDINTILESVLND